MNPAITVYNNAVFDFIHDDFRIETLAGDCLFTEGPVWNSAGYYLFSDTAANVIYRIVPGSEKQIYLSDSGTANPLDPDLKPGQVGSNGLAFDYNENLLICQHGSHGIARYNGKTLQPFITSYHHKPFNSPNDIILHSDGRIYFSDPPYGLKEGKLDPSKFQPLAGVYCRKEEIQLICDKYQYPNGVCLSPGEAFLYICSNKPFEKFISVYETAGNAFVKILAEENSDGIECDRNGNVYLCNKDGIILLNTNGQRLARIALPSIPANICWGGKGLNDLFITARENVFLIRDLQK